MRARSIVQVVSFAVIATVFAVWIQSRATAVDLQARLSALTTVHRDAARALEQERDRLRSELAETNRCRPADATVTSSEPAPSAPPSAATPSLPLGKWRSPKEWRNEGQSTACGTVATLLWAAAGGDLDAMMRIIVFDEAGRNQAQALFDTVPPAARQAFPTPEALVASLAIQAVPDHGVQLSWFHQRDADHAKVGLLVGAPGQTEPMEVLAVPALDNLPPLLVATRVSKLTVISLRRSSLGWRVVIPAAAIERLARLDRKPAP